MKPLIVHFRRALTNPRDFVLKSIPKNSVGVEIGVDRGNFSQRILKIVKPKKLYLIDPWKYEEGEIYKNSLYGEKSGKNQDELEKKYQKVLEQFQKQIKNNVVVIHRDYSEKALNSFANDSLDWAYIDGNHLYEFVKKDLELCQSKVKKGGIIVLDDYGVEGWWKDGVTKAVDEFINKGLLQVIKVKNNQCVLKK